MAKNVFASQLNLWYFSNFCLLTQRAAITKKQMCIFALHLSVLIYYFYNLKCFTVQKVRSQQSIVKLTYLKLQDVQVLQVYLKI